MLRRCLEAPNPCFGMIPPPRAAPSTSANGTTSTGNDYGIMLQIRNVQTFPDGRSLVETWGSWRFRIMERGMRDGYMVARIERIEDYEDELDRSAFAAAGKEEADGEPIIGEGSPQGTIPTGASSLEGSLDVDSAAEAGRVGQRLEASVRAGIGDVVVDIHSLSPEPSSHSATASSPLEPCADASPGAILASPLSLPRVPADDRDHLRSERTMLATGARPPAQPNGKAPEPRRPPTNAELMAKCHAFIEQTRQGTPWVVQQLNNNNFMPMPTDPAAFSFWMALVGPSFITHQPSGGYGHWAHEVRSLILSGATGTSDRRAREGQAPAYPLSATASSASRALDRAAEQPMVSNGFACPLCPRISSAEVSVCVLA